MTNALHKANDQTLNSAETEKISQSCKKRGLTVKQEAFVQAYIESGSASQAYRDAYDVSATTKPETVWQAASRLLADRKVAARVDEMHKMVEGQTLFAVEQALSEFEEARQLAMDNGQPSAAVAAITGKAKLFGMMTDRRHIDHRSGDRSMSPNGRPRVPFDPGMSLEEMEQWFNEELKAGK